MKCKNVRCFHRRIDGQAVRFKSATTYPPLKKNYRLSVYPPMIRQSAGGGQTDRRTYRRKCPALQNKYTPATCLFLDIAMSKCPFPWHCDGCLQCIASNHRSAKERGISTLQCRERDMWQEYICFAVLGTFAYKSAYPSIRRRRTNESQADRRIGGNFFSVADRWWRT